jgi:hypothetical protein
VLAWALAVFLLACVAAVIFARSLRARYPELPATASWTNEAGHEFAELSEAERCDLIFAVAALEDSTSHRLLERALDDPSEPVALAAASALARLGQRATVEHYLAARPGERATRIAQTLELLS